MEPGRRPALTRVRPCTTRAPRRRRCVWRSRIHKARNPPSSRARRQRHDSGFVEDGMAGKSSERQEGRTREALEENLELTRRLGSIRPAQSEHGTKRKQCGADEPRANDVAPTAERSLGDNLVSGAGVERPLARCLHPIPIHAGDGLDDRAHGETPAPELAGNERGRLLAAEDDPDDRQVLEHLAGGQVGDALAGAEAMTTSAPTIVTPLASKPRSLHHRREVEARPESRLVGSQAE